MCALDERWMHITYNIPPISWVIQSVKWFCPLDVVVVVVVIVVIIIVSWMRKLKFLAPILVVSSKAAATAVPNLQVFSLPIPSRIKLGVGSDYFVYRRKYTKEERELQNATTSSSVRSFKTFPIFVHFMTALNMKNDPTLARAVICVICTPFLVAFDNIHRNYIYYSRP